MASNTAYRARTSEVREIAASSSSAATSSASILRCRTCETVTFALPRGTRCERGHIGAAQTTLQESIATFVNRVVTAPFHGRNVPFGYWLIAIID